ncbi:uncharacterized protein M6B38_304055 [Iris pallida]|uniref:Non-structural maintenance of chromosomes element 1 homolog n=1 Tax=Iris pallida TaxID=29817 RepID=A0AAX6HM01_IRIPA|nr:uncharacterized protein M6B38_304055 [Iris pallida]
MSQLNWRHHTLIQALLARGPLKESDFQSVFYGVTGKNPVTRQSFYNDFLFKINKELAYVQLELRGCRNQYDGKVYYGVVNNVSDEQSKLGTKYTMPQIAFYKGVIEAIVQDVTNQGCITSIEALNIRLENQEAFIDYLKHDPFGRDAKYKANLEVQAASSSQDSQSHVPAAFKSFSIAQKEKTLRDLIQDRWLSSTSDGKIGLGVRSFLDLRGWFRSNDIPSCDVCNEAGVKAVTCPKEDCPIRIHDYCLKKKYSIRKVARICPGCSTAWPLSSGNGDQEEVEEEEEAEAEEGASRNEQGNVSSNNQATGRRRLRSVKAEAVEAANSHSQEPSGPVRRKRQRTCKAEAVEAAEDAAKTEEPEFSLPSNNLRSLRSRRR